MWDPAIFVLVACSHTCTGLVPAATIFMPSAMMAADRMVAVVVPSPAVSLVFAAACELRRFRLGILAKERSSPCIRVRGAECRLQHARTLSP